MQTNYLPTGTVAPKNVANKMLKVIIDFLIEISVVCVTGIAIYYFFFLRPDKIYEKKIKPGRKFQVNQLHPGTYEYLDIWMLCGKEVVVARLIKPSEILKLPEVILYTESNKVNEWIMIIWRKEDKILLPKSDTCYVGTFEIIQNPKKPFSHNREVEY